MGLIDILYPLIMHGASSFLNRNKQEPTGFASPFPSTPPHIAPQPNDNFNGFKLAISNSYPMNSRPIPIEENQSNNGIFPVMGQTEEKPNIPTSSFSHNTTPSPETLTPLVTALFPTLSRKITSPYGKRTAPKAGASTFHQGIDIGGSIGDKLMSALSGTIQKVGYDKLLGNYAKILADNGMTLTYGHANGFNVKPGQKIKAGGIIGTLGSTGNSTGPHLHFGVSQNGAYIDPMTLFKKKGY